MFPGVVVAAVFLCQLVYPLALGPFLASNAAIMIFLAALASAGDTLTGFVLAGTLWQRLSTILEAAPEANTSKAHPGALRGEISVENVTFRYRHDGPMILESVSIHAKPGECIALTGPSGCGKSTLLNLLLRFEIHTPAPSTSTDAISPASTLPPCAARSASSRRTPGSCPVHCSKTSAAAAPTPWTTRGKRLAQRGGRRY